MTLQMRPKSGVGQVVDVAYAPARDICYLYPNVVSQAEEMLYQPRFAALQAWLDAEGVTEQDRATVVETYCLFLNAAHQNPEETIEDVMDRVGFSKIHPAAQVAFMFYIGTIMTGTFFKGIRDITPLEGDTTPEVQRLVQTGQRAADYALAGPIRRWWIRFKRRTWPLKRAYTISGKVV